MTQTTDMAAAPVRALIEEAAERLRAVSGETVAVQVSPDGRKASARLDDRPQGAGVGIEAELVEPDRHAANLGKFLDPEQVAERVGAMLRADGRDPRGAQRAYVRLFVHIDKAALKYTTLVDHHADDPARACAHTRVESVCDAMAFLRANARLEAETATA